MATIIGVHGISQEQYGPAQLLRRWLPALADGVLFAAGHEVDLPHFDVAFYGDFFLPEGASGVPVKGNGGPAGSDILDWLVELDEEERGELVEAALEVVPGARAEIEDRTDGQAKSGSLRTPIAIQTVAGAIGRNFGAAGIVLFFGDLVQVRRYLHDPTLKANIDARVAAVVGSERKIVIGHSLGSVVAYEHLRQQSPAEPLALFLTIGSPLGLKMVRKWLSKGTEPDGPAGLPGVDRWVNVFDRRDPVACAGRLERWWPAVREWSVDNGSRAHDAEGYLSKAVCGSAVLAAIGSPR